VGEDGGRPLDELSNCPNSNYEIGVFYEKGTEGHLEQQPHPSLI